MKTIWISTGEVSGDIHASHVVRAIHAIDSSIHIRGIGGEHAREAGMECVFSIASLSVMGIWSVIKKFFSIFKLIRAIKQDFIQTQPDALLVIDAPSFNFLLIRIAHKMGIPVYYYIIPKVWASRPQRVHFLATMCRQLFCIFPFEVEWLAHYGIEARYVGNPLLDYIQPVREQQYTREHNHIIFMPGSRKSEVEALFPIYIDVIRMLQNYDATLRFSYILAPSLSQDYVTAYIPDDITLDVIFPQHRYDVIAQATLCVVASGTATLETTLLGTPTIVTYKLGSCSAWLMKQFITIPFVSLPNIIMNKRVVPELLQGDATAKNIYTHILPLLISTSERNHMIDELTTLYNTMQTTQHAPDIVARYIISDSQNK